MLISYFNGWRSGKKRGNCESCCSPTTVKVLQTVCFSSAGATIKKKERPTTATSTTTSFGPLWSKRKFSSLCWEVPNRRKKPSLGLAFHTSFLINHNKESKRCSWFDLSLFPPSIHEKKGTRRKKAICSKRIEEDLWSNCWFQPLGIHWIGRPRKEEGPCAPLERRTELSFRNSRMIWQLLPHLHFLRSFRLLPASHAPTISHTMLDQDYLAWYPIHLFIWKVCYSVATENYHEYRMRIWDPGKVSLDCKLHWLNQSSHYRLPLDSKKVQCVRW